MQKSKKTVLLITDHYPPEQSGAVARTRALHIYLSKKFNVVVFTLNNYGEVPGEDKNSVFRFEGSIFWQKKITLKKLIIKLLGKVYECFYASRDFIFERNILKSSMLKRINPDLIYGTYPGLSSWILAIKLSKKYQAKLVLEYRDGFSFEPIEKQNFLSKILKRRMEKRFLRNTDLAVTIGDSLTADLEGIIKSSKIKTIYNGSEKEYFQDLNYNATQKQKGNQVHIIHFGSILKSKDRDISCLIKFLKNYTFSGKRIIFEFIGNLNYKEQMLFSSIENKNLEIRIKKPIPKLEGFQYILDNADFLFLYGDPGQKTFISSKLFEYLFLAKPILAICLGNDAEKIIKKANAGLVADFHENSISEIFNKALSHNFIFSPNKAFITDFQRKNQITNLSLELAELWDKNE